MYTVGIYGIYNPKTGECLYIGCSKEIEKRYCKYHLPRLANGSHRRKDFSEWFIQQEEKEPTVLRILEVCPSVNELNNREVFWFWQEKPKFYGKLPSVNENWKYSEESRKKLSESTKIRAADPERSPWACMKRKRGEEGAIDFMKSIGFTSETAAAAARKGSLGKKKSEAHRLALSEAALKRASEILTCEFCSQTVKGPSALGRHKKAKHSPA